MLLTDILETQYGWTPDLKPKTGKNKGRYTAGRITPRPYKPGVWIAPNKWNWVVRDPYKVMLGDVMAPGTVWSVKDVRINGSYGPYDPDAVLYTGRLIAWGMMCGGGINVVFVTPHLDEVFIWPEDIGTDLAAWELVPPSEEEQVAVAMTEAERYATCNSDEMIDHWRSFL